MPIIAHNALPVFDKLKDEGIRVLDATVTAELLAPGRGMGVVCRDFTNDNRPDNYVANLSLGVASDNADGLVPSRLCGHQP